MSAGPGAFVIQALSQKPHPFLPKAQKGGQSEKQEGDRYQTRQTFSVGLTIGWPGLQAKASAYSGMFTTTPLMRY